MSRYEAMNATVRKNLGKLFADTEVSDIAFMAWPNAGHFEGWAAYMEYLGKDVGLYRDGWSELGK